MKTKGGHIEMSDSLTIKLDPTLIAYFRLELYGCAFIRLEDCGQGFIFDSAQFKGCVDLTLILFNMKNGFDILFLSCLDE